MCVRTREWQQVVLSVVIQQATSAVALQPLGLSNHVTLQL